MGLFSEVQIVDARDAGKALDRISELVTKYEDRIVELEAELEQEHVRVYDLEAELDRAQDRIAELEKGED